MHACMHICTQRREVKIFPLSLFVSAEDGVKRDCQDDSRDGGKEGGGKEEKGGKPKLTRSLGRSRLSA